MDYSNSTKIVKVFLKNSRESSGHIGTVKAKKSKVESANAEGQNKKSRVPSYRFEFYNRNY